MAGTPVYTAVPRMAAAIIGNADTSLTAPATVSTLFSGVTSGTRIEEITVCGVGNITNGMVNLFLHDGSTYHLFDQMQANVNSQSSTTPTMRMSRFYENIVIPNSSWSLRATQTVAGNNSLLAIVAVGGDYANYPSYADSIFEVSALGGTADTSLTAPTNVTTIGSGGTKGTKIEQIIVHGVGTTSVGNVNVFVHNSSTYYLYDQIHLQAVTSSTTARALNAVRSYKSLMLPDANWSLRITHSNSSNNSLLKYTVIGSNF